MPIDLQDLNPVFAQKLKALLDAARAQGIDPGTIASGYRTNAQQAGLYADKLSGKIKGMVAPPGGSMHNYGLATDVSSPDIQKLRAFATAHPDMGIYPLPGDTPHLQLAGNQNSLMANPPSLPQGQSFDPVAALKAYLGPSSALTAKPPSDPNVPPPPSQYGYASSTPNAVPATATGTNLNSVPPDVAAAVPPPSIASMIGAGDYGGAFGAAAANPMVKSGMEALGKGMGGGDAASSAIPEMKPPNLQTNSAQIAQMAPQLMAQLLAQQQQQRRRPDIPGLSLGGYGGL